MSEAPALFDFSPFAGQSASHVQVLREFAAGRPFRSATVEELVLDDDFYRRALRPEDLSFLKFTKPTRPATVSRLSSLASQRFLNSLYELTSAAAPPPEAELHRHQAFDEFAGERNRRHATRLLPFLEAYAFEYLGNCLPASEPASSYSGRLGRIYADEYQFWIRVLGQLSVNDYLHEGLRFVLIQRWCLAPSIRSVLAGAAEQGRRDGWPAGAEPSVDAGPLGDGSMGRIAATLDVNRRQHSYWQFYLPTSLSKCNLLHALARRVEPFALYGALYAAQAERLALEAAIARCCPEIVAGIHVSAAAVETHVERLLKNFAATLERVGERHSPASARRMGQGLAAAGMLADRARWDLGEQLKWLSAIDRYCELARTISRRIDAECPDIDRETFVEPREMCSTTHVHDDHRLVTIEAGVMHFWGNLGMRLEMHPGDRVLIPEGRLHGSTVLSAECTYHQPIIPDAWIRELVDQAPARQRASVPVGA